MASGCRHLSLVCLVLSVLGITALHAHGQAASQPHVDVSAWAWLKANLLWLIPTVSLMLSTLATSLTKRVPKATGLVTALLVLADMLSFWGHKDSPTTINVPGRRSAPPVTPVSG